MINYVNYFRTVVSYWPTRTGGGVHLHLHLEFFKSTFFPLVCVVGLGLAYPMVFEGAESDGEGFGAVRGRGAELWVVEVLNFVVEEVEVRWNLC